MGGNDSSGETNFEVFQLLFYSYIMRVSLAFVDDSYQASAYTCGKAINLFFIHLEKIQLKVKILEFLRTNFPAIDYLILKLFQKVESDPGSPIRLPAGLIIQHPLGPLKLLVLESFFLFFFNHKDPSVDLVSLVSTKSLHIITLLVMQKKTNSILLSMF